METKKGNNKDYRHESRGSQEDDRQKGVRPQE